MFPAAGATVTYDKEAETVSLEFGSELCVGEAVISLSYSGCLNDQMRGFYRSKYTVDGEERYAAVTQFEVRHLPADIVTHTLTFYACLCYYPSI